MYDNILLYPLHAYDSGNARSFLGWTEDGLCCGFFVKKLVRKKHFRGNNYIF